MSLTNNNEYLSQEEIDALLHQSSDDNDAAADSSASDEGSTEKYLTDLERDALGEIGNITFGSAATALSTLLGKKVDITTPQVSIVPHEELKSEFPKPHVAVHVKYVDGFQGINLLVIKTDDAKVIADLMLGGDGKSIQDEELNEIHISAIQEAMNQMMGSSATSMSTIFNRLVNISPPGIDILDLSTGEGTERVPDEDVLIKVSFRLTIEDLIDSSIMQLLPVSFSKELVSSLMGGAEEADDQVAATATQVETNEAPVSPAPESPTTQQPAVGQEMPQPSVPVSDSQQHIASEPAARYAQQPANQQFNRNVNVQPVQYTTFDGQPSMQADDTNLNLLLDIPLKVTVELGRTQKQIREILELSQGSIIELDKLAGEPVDILVNNKLIAKGEVVVIDENFGVRVTDIVSQKDRLRKIQ